MSVSFAVHNNISQQRPDRQVNKQTNKQTLFYTLPQGFYLRLVMCCTGTLLGLSQVNRDRPLVRSKQSV